MHCCVLPCTSIGPHAMHLKPAPKKHTVAAAYKCKQTRKKERNWSLQMLQFIHTYCTVDMNEPYTTS